MKIPSPRPMRWLPEIDHHQFSCTERVGIALQQDSSLRGQIGLLLERALTDDGRLIWVAVCAHHCWTTDSQGHVVETSCGTFADPLDGLQLVGEPRQRRWIQLRPEQQERCLRLASQDQLRTTAELIYCPGQIAMDQVPSQQYARTWSALAAECSAAGGWDAETWQRMDQLLVEQLAPRPVTTLLNTALGAA